MERTTFEELKSCRLSAMNAEERAEFDEAYEQSRLAIEVDEKLRVADNAAASRSGTGFTDHC